MNAPKTKEISSAHSLTLYLCFIASHFTKLSAHIIYFPNNNSKPYLSLGRPRLAARLANSCIDLRIFSAVESSVEASSSSATENVVLSDLTKYRSDPQPWIL